MCFDAVRDGSSSVSKEHIHLTLAAVEEIDQYSASVEERVTLRCFLELQKMRLRPRFIMNALVEVKSSLLLTQLTLENA